MTPFNDIKNILQKALKKGISASEAKTLVHYCSFLALPYLRKKIRLGKINLSILAMSEEDIIFDALAELFQYNLKGVFPQLQTQFALTDFTTCSNEEIIIHLRKIVFIYLHKAIIRLYGETDPTTAKIIRNIKLGVQKTGLFDEVSRFEETMLIVRGIDPLFHKCLMQRYEFQQRMSAHLNMRDTIPQILTKMHTLLSDQSEYQRAVSMIECAFVVKDLYVIGWETENVSIPTVEDTIDTEKIKMAISNICRSFENEIRATYVDTGKVSSQMLPIYIKTIESVIDGEYFDGINARRSYFDCLKGNLPDVTQQEYFNNHRTIIEYLVKKVRMEIEREMKNF
ncbi:MAG: hypothetical protein HYV29_14370 [Ignavibacteriales bacterium]|nr:hypothetical protein [Ignavibacteriales bacterium]